MTASFHICYSSLVTNHPAIRRHFSHSALVNNPQLW